MATLQSVRPADSEEISPNRMNAVRVYQDNPSRHE